MTPTVTLRQALNKGILTDLIISEIIFSEKQTAIWLPTPDKDKNWDVEYLQDSINKESKNTNRILIGKLTQGEYDSEGIRRRSTAKLITDPEELKFVIDDAVLKDPLCFLVLATGFCIASIYLFDLKSINWLNWKQIHMISQSHSKNMPNVTIQTPVIEPHFVCYRCEGRLGNQLFQYASIYGIAMMNNLSIIAQKSCDIAQYFRVRNLILVHDANTCSSFKVLSEIMPRVFNESFFTLPMNVNIFLRGYFQSWKYFQNVKDTLLEQLTFIEPIETRTRGEMDFLKSNYINVTGSSPTIIGIHVRLGDIFIDSRYRRKGIEFAPPGYINKSMRYYIARYRRILFIVCSDTIVEAKATIDSFNLNVTIHYMKGKREPIEDLCILALCEHVIQTVGTFGWWAAYLSRGTSLYYKFPGRQSSVVEKRLNSYDYFYPEWTGLDSE
ncbi:hypothetical protein CHS0354_020290 [Potamilus streckersoni]|uniref:L-Fucosyltransferase n=1 Tax=Potamilus streckersoni TaxID=2493646 RepID=A0AAE0VQQ7_9BIVA|nr:hypothetical protein CHS0354_020290 [Potamilus streckersoni]